MGRKWFSDDFIGTVVTFSDEANNNISSWTLHEKLSDHGSQYGKEEAGEETYSSACAVFRSFKESGSGPQEAIVKIYMQIPWWNTENTPTKVRATQAVDDINSASWWELEAFKDLTAACSESTPHLLAKKITKQNEAYMWIPGGFIVYILMTKISGQPPYDFDRLPLFKREAIRRSIKDAWHECRAVGIIHSDPGRQNLIWNEKRNKCYIVDFGFWQEAQDYHVWGNGEFSKWGLMTYDLEHGSRQIP